MVERVLTMTIGAVVQLLALTLLVLISVPRVLDQDLDPRYRLAHGAVVVAALAAGAWRLSRRRP